MKKIIIGDGQHEKTQDVELKEVNYDQKDMRWFVDETEFDGHHTLWGFEYFPTTYLKSSSLSGNEYRKGGEIRYYRDRNICFTEFCRDPKIAALKIGQTLLKLMDFEWDNIKIGKKVYYDRTPAVIAMLIPEQGCVVLETENGDKFPDAIWKDESTGPMGEREESVKVEILDNHIWWYRK